MSLIHYDKNINEHFYDQKSLPSLLDSLLLRPHLYNHTTITRGCGVYFNLFAWATGSCLLFLRLCFATSGPCREAHVKYLKSLLFWCHLTLAQSRDE